MPAVHDSDLAGGLSKGGAPTQDDGGTQSGRRAPMSNITNAEKLACAERELKMRKRVYPRWVEDGRMSLAQMHHEIAAMESICQDYRDLTAKERLL